MNIYIHTYIYMYVGLYAMMSVYLMDLLVCSVHRQVTYRETVIDIPLAIQES